MDNFQLYRTNLLLSGQMKWDIILDNDSNILHVSDFDLTPINNNISYIYKSNKFPLKNSHTDNVKLFFNSFQGDFFNEGLDPEFAHSWPIVSSDINVRNYFNAYDMGCRRTSFYKLHKKQFEFFCPIWLEHLDGKLSFKFVIKSQNSNDVITSKILHFDYNSFQTHNNFIKYFNDHIDKCGIKDGNDNIINIDFDKNTAYVNGLNAKTGIIETKDVSTIINQLTSRERPLMETDNIIINLFADNNMICNNLYNFNFCFNLTDIVSSTIASMLYGKNITVSVYAMIDDTELLIKDFYTNYEFINKDIYHIDNDSNASLYKNINVLDYLNDNAYIEFKDKNKFCQKICHWSLCDNNEYIFNLYDGFSGLCIQNNTIIENSHNYGKTPDTFTMKHSFSLNNSGWVNNIEVNNWGDLEEILLDVDYLYETGNKVCNDKYINNIKYDIESLTYDGYSIKNKDVAILSIITDFNTLLSLSGSSAFDKYKISNESSKFITYLVKVRDNLILVSDNYDGLTFRNVYNMLKQIPLNNADIKFMLDFMNAKCDPKIVSICGALNWDYCSSPSCDSREIEYFKNDKEHNYVIRYDGKIKPTFIDGSSLKNELYYKDIIKDDITQYSKYSKYSNSGFAPLYSSLNYYAINNVKSFDYSTVPYINVSAYNEKLKLIRSVEYSWFNSGSIMHISPELNFTYINRLNLETNRYDALNEIVYNLLRSYYKTDDEAVIKHIMSLYDIKNTWDYLNADNINDYVYDIHLTMK